MPSSRDAPPHRARTVRRLAEQPPRAPRPVPAPLWPRTPRPRYRPPARRALRREPPVYTHSARQPPPARSPQPWAFLSFLFFVLHTYIDAGARRSGLGETSGRASSFANARRVSCSRNASSRPSPIIMSVKRRKDSFSLVFDFFLEESRPSPTASRCSPPPSIKMWSFLKRKVAGRAHP